MAQIFLSYRRSDSQYATRSISDRLQQTLGKDALFQDVKTVRLGEDFEARVNNILENCEVMLVVMGDDWLSVKDEDGQRRLDNPDDLVRREVAAALTNEKTVVIPVLTGGAEMPRPEQLPDDLKALSTRNAATVRADASFDAQMDALIAEILRQAPELRPVVRYGKIGLIATAAVAVIFVASLFYGSMRPPVDLTSIRWSGKLNGADILEFGKEHLQGIYLRTEEDGDAIEGDELTKYELSVDIRDRATGEASDLLSATQAYWTDLAETHPDRKKKGAFLHLVAGERQGVATVILSYQNSDKEVVKSTVKEIEILPPRDVERAATEEFNRVIAAVNDQELDDKAVRSGAYKLLNNRDGLSLSNALAEDQRDRLADIIGKAENAIGQFKYASGLSSSEMALAERSSAWNDYVGAANELGRQASPQLTVANNALTEIAAFRGERMDIVEAAACTEVVDRECARKQACFGAGTPIVSWAKLKVSPATATITHRLVSSDDARVFDAETTEVQRSSGYRSHKSLRADEAAGEMRAQVTFDGVVVSSLDVCVGSCAACP